MKCAWGQLHGARFIHLAALKCSAAKTLGGGAAVISLAHGTRVKMLVNNRVSREVGTRMPARSVCLASGTVPIRSGTWTLRRPAILHRHLPYHSARDMYAVAQSLACKEVNQQEDHCSMYIRMVHTPKGEQRYAVAEGLRAKIGLLCPLPPPPPRLTH